MCDQPCPNHVYKNKASNDVRKKGNNQIQKILSNIPAGVESVLVSASVLARVGQSVEDRRTSSSFLLLRGGGRGSSRALRKHDQPRQRSATLNTTPQQTQANLTVLASEGAAFLGAAAFFSWSKQNTTKMRKPSTHTTPTHTRETGQARTSTTETYKRHALQAAGHTLSGGLLGSQGRATVGLHTQHTSKHTHEARLTVTKSKARQDPFPTKVRKQCTTNAYLEFVALGAFLFRAEGEANKTASDTRGLEKHSQRQLTQRKLSTIYCKPHNASSKFLHSLCTSNTSAAWATNRMAPRRRSRAG